MTKPIYEDPIVAEIHAIRQSLLDDCGGDVNEYRKGARQRQDASERSVITKPFRDRTEQTIEPKAAKSDELEVENLSSPPRDL